MSEGDASRGDASRGDYFTNHAKASRWPFTIYHRPLEERLAAAVRDVVVRVPRPRALVFGCGLFHEAKEFRDIPELILVDADRRLEPALLELARHRDGVTLCFATSAAELAAAVPPASVDLIVSKEVIEHLGDAQQYLRVLGDCLKPGGKLWLSTPNYGSPVLPFLEATFLEVVARAQGFSRRHIHPNKYSRRRLLAELRAAGLADVEVEATPWTLALAASGVKR